MDPYINRDPVAKLVYGYRLRDVEKVKYAYNGEDDQVKSIIICMIFLPFFLTLTLYCHIVRLDIRLCMLRMSRPQVERRYLARGPTQQVRL